MASKDIINEIAEFIKETLNDSNFVILPEDTMASGLQKACVRINKIEEFHSRSGQYPNGHMYLLADSDNKSRSR